MTAERGDLKSSEPARPGVDTQKSDAALQKSGEPAPYSGEAPDSSAAPSMAADLPERPPPSFPEIFQTHARFLWRTLRGLGIPEADADDLCQDVMIVAHRRLREFNGQSIRGWLYGICVRVASDYRRSARVRRQSKEPLPETPVLPRAENEAFGRELEDRLLDVLNTLDYEKRVVFILYEVEELTLREIADALGVPLQTVYSRLRVARQQVREAFTLPEPKGAR